MGSPNARGQPSPYCNSYVVLFLIGQILSLPPVELSGNLSLQVRLVNGYSNCSGHVEICNSSQWYAVCDDSWDINDAEVVCKQLGCGRAKEATVSAYFGRVAGPFTLKEFHCSGTELFLSSCSVTPLSQSTCDTSEKAGVICEGNYPLPVRLTNGSSSCNGRVDIYFNSQWGTICDDSWDFKDAEVVCRHVGCGRAQSFKSGAYFGKGTGPITMADIRCRGDEQYLSDCIASPPFPHHNCGHEKDAGVICKDVDKCTTMGICGDFSVCSNTAGSYTCTCQQGFQSKSRKDTFTDVATSGCVDLNECEVDKGICGDYAICHNTIGSYSCSCKEGFRLVSKTNASPSGCNDLNECEVDKGICGDYAICHNTIGSYSCSCKEGFRLVSKTNASPSGCNGQTCVCCPETPNPNVLQCSSGNFIFSNKTQNIFNDLRDSLRFNDSNTTLQNEVQQKKITRFLRNVEENIVLDVLSSLNKSGATEEEIYHYTNETGTLPFAMLTSFHGTEIESILSGGYLINKTYSDYNYTVNSKVVIATISSKWKHSLTDPVFFTFQITKNDKDNVKRHHCVFWKTDKENRSGWSREGCFLSETNSNKTQITCECEHLSSFCVLMVLDETFQDEPALNIISYIGLSLSVICLILSILTFLLCQSIRTANTTMLINLCFCLLIADVVFLFGISQTKTQILCRIIAAFLHYFFLACFCWMCIGALQLQLMVQNLKALRAFQRHSIKKRYIYPVTYGVPAVIVTVSAAIFPGGYGTTEICWLSPERGFIWSFMGPVCFIIVVNIFLFIKTVHELREYFQSIDKDVSKIKNTKIPLFKAIAQFLVLGCTWIFGMFQFHKVKIVMSYLFTILNSFHGVFIFLLYCATNKQVIDKYKICLRRLFSTKRKGKETSIITSTATATTSATNAATGATLPLCAAEAYNMELIKNNEKTKKNIE
ncbi:adhesion G protein-coupled receptor E2-like isoform X2 [Protopterus annectens]|uniref:adhesion G protein-coupled receptor E2-like isoform X2 n=1 Tax=Protopterus annectens TaxID=7888 RepID=UPI001CF9D7E5|nr:adhesion G protein-coupled receptor E2-like isoform X2 [Protopterus annectens]